MWQLAVCGPRRDGAISFTAQGQWCREAVGSGGELRLLLPIASVAAVVFKRGGAAALTAFAPTLSCEPPLLRSLTRTPLPVANVI